MAFGYRQRYGRPDLNNQFDFESFLRLFTVHFEGFEGNLLDVSRRGQWTVKAEYDLCRMAYLVVVVHERLQFYNSMMVTDMMITEMRPECDNTGIIPMTMEIPAPQERNYTVQQLLEMANSKLDEQLEAMKK